MDSALVELLREKLKDAGLKKARFGEKIGVSRSKGYNILDGKTSVNIQDLEKICITLGYNFFEYLSQKLKTDISNEHIPNYVEPSFERKASDKIVELEHPKYEILKQENSNLKSENSQLKKENLLLEKLNRKSDKIEHLLERIVTLEDEIHDLLS
ncbi:MAG: helix-turn-helix domain-containing protein [Bacteroidota bacterium]